MTFLMSLHLLNGCITVVSSVTLMDVDIMDLVINRNAWFWTLSNVKNFDDIDTDDSVDPYSMWFRIIRCIHSSKPFLQHPSGFLPVF